MTTTSKRMPARPRKPRSRVERWTAALDRLRELASDGGDALDRLHASAEALHEAAETLRAIRDEYQGWLDALPDGNLGEGATRDKLEEITATDIDQLEDAIAAFEALVEAIETDAIRDSLTAIDGVVEEIEAVEPPRGGGRD